MRTKLFRSHDAAQELLDFYLSKFNVSSISNVSHPRHKEPKALLHALLFGGRFPQASWSWAVPFLANQVGLDTVQMVEPFPQVILTTDSCMHGAHSIGSCPPPGTVLRSGCQATHGHCHCHCAESKNNQGPGMLNCGNRHMARHAASRTQPNCSVGPTAPSPQ